MDCFDLVDLDSDPTDTLRARCVEVVSCGVEEDEKVDRALVVALGCKTMLLVSCFLPLCHILENRLDIFMC